MADDDDNKRSGNAADLFGDDSSSDEDSSSSSSDLEGGGGGSGNGGNPTPPTKNADAGDGVDGERGGDGGDAAGTTPSVEAEEAAGDEEMGEGKAGGTDENDDAEKDIDPAPLTTDATAAAAKDTDDEDDGDKVTVGGGGGGDNRALFGDDDSSTDSDSSGEGDAEFDDAGAAIVGRSAIEGKDDTAPLPSSARRELDEKFEEAEGGQSSGGPAAEIGGDGEGEPGTPQQPGRRERKPLPPKTLSVPDVERPFVAKGTVTATGRKKRVTLHMTKLPNVLGINTTPFDRHNYDPLYEEEMYGSLMSNMIRWRYARDPTNGDGLARDDRGNLIRESNARVVRWSDGTSSLYIGGEMFDLDNMGGGANKQPGGAGGEDKDDKASEGKDGTGGSKGWGYLYLSQRAVQVPNAENSDDEVPPPPPEDEDAPTYTVLECVGNIQSRVTARPSSLQSASHKSMTLKVKQRNLKKARIAEIVTMVDPEKEKMDRIAMKDEVLRSEAGRASRNYRPGGGGGGRRRPAMSREYLESAEDESKYDSYSISNLKKKRFAENDEDDEFLDYGDSDDDEEDDEWSKRKREGLWRQKNKGKQGKGGGGGKSLRESSSEEEAMFQEESDDDEEEAPAARSGGARKRAAAFDDDED